jgi:two-component system LytT family response regulator
MIKTIIIDDETLAINLMRVLLTGFEQVRVEASFTDAEEALEYLKENNIDLVFLDIEMPGTDGLEMAQLILNLDIHVQIVFATAYSQYALEAFELNALDYLLKPISKERLAKTIERVESRIDSEMNALKNIKGEGTQVPHIISFGEFNLYKGKRQDDKVNFRTSKSKELLAFLHENINHPVHKGKALEGLFAEENPEKANASLHTSTYYLRKILGSFGFDKALEYKNGYFLFKEGLISSDVLEFKKIMNNRRDAIENNPEMYEKLLQIYKGKYLDKEAYAWSTDYAPWYEERFINAITGLAKFYFDRREYDSCVKASKRLIEEDPYNEEAYYFLIKSFLGKNEKAKAINAYEKLNETLATELGIKPSREISELKKELQ